MILYESAFILFDNFLYSLAKVHKKFSLVSLLLFFTALREQFHVLVESCGRIENDKV